MNLKNRSNALSFAGAFPQLPAAPYVIPAVVALAAVVLGIGIGQGLWIFGIAAVLIPLLILYPVQVAFGLFVLLLPFDAIPMGQGEKGTTVTALAGAGTAAVLIAVGLATRRLRSLPSGAVWWALFTLWSLGTSAWALNFDASFEMVPTILALLALYLVSSCFRYNEKELKTIVFFSILGGFIAAVWTAYLFMQGSFYEAGPETRASLIVGRTHTNPDGLGMTLLLPISLAFGVFLISKKRLVKISMLAAMGVSSLGLLLTMSRAAFLALLALLVVYVIRLRLGKRIIGPAIILSICLALMPSVFFTRFQDARGDGGSGRTDIWTVGLKAFQHYGLVGAGLSNFPFAYTNYMGEAPRYRGAYRDPHNIYLAVAVETGVIGIALFAFSLRSQFRAARRLKDQASLYNLLTASEAACWALLVFGLFGNNLWSKSFWLPWMLMSAAVTAAQGSLASASSRVVPEKAVRNQLRVVRSVHGF